MSTAHTPGPWRVAPASLYVGSDINVDAGANGYIALCGKLGDETAAANARLIASAPDLLAALIGVVRIADRETDEFDAARAAIAKALS